MLSESFLPFFQWCERTAIGTAVRDHIWAFPAIETFHLLALAVLLGSVLIVNARAFGVGRSYAPVSEIASELEPWLLVSLAVLIVSGILMMLSEPMKCYESVSFPIKMILLAVAIVFHFTVQRKRIGSKFAAAVSILLWTGIGIAGKGIPYV